jgi:NADH-quinone oxidoreductase subunit J
MESVAAQMPLLVFLVVGTVAVAASILVVSMRNPVHSALFLLLTFLCVAVLFVLRNAEFVAAVQVLVYAGGVMVLFLFVVMLINVRALPDEAVLSRYWKGGVLAGVAVLILLGTLVRGGVYHAQTPDPRVLNRVREKVIARSAENPDRFEAKWVWATRENRNSEAVAMALYTKYLVPFEVASLFLLVAMIGAIVIGKRDLMADEEETTPRYILERAETEKEIKEAMSA